MLVSMAVRLFCRKKIPMYPKIIDIFQTPPHPHLNQKMGPTIRRILSELLSQFRGWSLPFFVPVFLDSNRGAGKTLILGHTGSLVSEERDSRHSHLVFRAFSFLVYSVKKKLGGRHWDEGTQN